MKEEAEKERTLALERERLHKQYQEELKMRQEKEVRKIVVLVIKPIALLTFSLPSLSSDLKVPNIILSPPLGNTELSAGLLTFARLFCQGLPSKLVCGRTSSVCKYHHCSQRPLLFPAKDQGKKASASREVKSSTVEQRAACLISRAGPILRV